MINDYYFPKTITPSHFNIKPYDYLYLTYGESSKGVQVDKNFIYSFNNFGHRSEDFKTVKNNLNILFSGCSLTFGESLPYKQNWSGKLYKLIQDKYYVDNYYNLSFLGGSTELIIFNIFMYCKTFGNPDVIFLLLPDSSRKIILNNKRYDNYMNPNENEDDRTLMLLKSYFYIKMLEQYCFSNNIKLVWSCWFEKDIKDFYSSCYFDNFVKIDNYKVLYNAKNDSEKNNIFYNIGRDNVHPGLQYSDGMARIFYEEFLERWDNEDILKKNIIKN